MTIPFHPVAVPLAAKWGLWLVSLAVFAVFAWRERGWLHANEPTQRLAMVCILIIGVVVFPMSVPLCDCSDWWCKVMTYPMCGLY